MGAIYITIPTDRYGDNTKRYLIYPIVMLIERDGNVSDVEEDDGTDIPVLDEENTEKMRSYRCGVIAYSFGCFLREK